MRCLLAAIFLLAGVANPATAGPKEDALQVLEKWTKAFTDSDVDGIVALYAPDALFLGTASKAVVTDGAPLRKYFETALAGRKRTARLDSSSVLVVSDSVVAVSGLDTLTAVRDGTVATSNGRVTFVIAKRGSDWKIVQFHRSPLPK
jgi:uncharacterized protein (TIGR02246 family)